MHKGKNDHVVFVVPPFFPPLVSKNVCRNNPVVIGAADEKGSNECLVLFESRLKKNYQSHLVVSCLIILYAKCSIKQDVISTHETINFFSSCLSECILFDF